jgi:hypothetical protein
MNTEHAANPLRRARLAARLELRDLAERTRISPAMLRHMDEGAFHRLPAGIYARAWVRSVAKALALDPEEVLAQLDRSLPKASGAEDPPTAVADSPAAPQPSAHAWWENVSQRLPADGWRRAAVAAIDGALLTGITLLVWIATALAAGSTPSDIGPAAAIGISFTALTLAFMYFSVFAGIGGRTPGAALLGCPAVPGDRTPLDLASIGRRALATALAEASIVVDVTAAGGLEDVLVRSAFRRT